MEITICDNYESMSRLAGSIIMEEIKKKPFSLVTFAAGNTPNGILRFLVRLCRDQENVFKDAFFVGLDEWVGMDGSDVGSCRNTLDKAFFHPLGINDSQIFFFNGKSTDLSKECDRIAHYLEEMGPLDLALIGIGLNGHVGFNEPGSIESSGCRCVNLKESTQKNGQYYFDLNKDLTRGLTLGIKELMGARSVILVADGSQKAGILKDLMTKEIGPEIPVSFLRRHPNCRVIVDKEACSEIEVGSEGKRQL